MKPAQSKHVVFQPNVYQGMLRGIDQMVSAVRPTLGPMPRWVALSQNQPGKIPELLDDGGLIMRRIIQIPDRDADMGAMFIRQMAWQVHEKTGDGTATAAVMFQSIFEQGGRYLAAGGNSQRLRGCLEDGLHIVLQELKSQTVPVRGKSNLSKIAEAGCHDPALAKLLGEIFDIIGEYGRLEIRPGRGREHERQYVEGAYWESEIVSREMIRDTVHLRSELHNSAILISDLEIRDPHTLVPLLDAMIQAGIPSFLLLAQKVSEQVIALLYSANRNPEKFQALAYKIPGSSPHERAAVLSDLAILTGGRFVCQEAGEVLESVRLQDLGRARRVWAEFQHFGIVDGRHDPHRLRAYLADLRVAARGAKDKTSGNQIEMRIGRLLGGAATLLIGGVNENEVNASIERAERVALTLRTVVKQGVVPGGGAALLACRPAIDERIATSQELDEVAALKILRSALEAPFRVILSNAGYDPSRTLSEIEQKGKNFGFDVRTGQVVDMLKAGIADATGVVEAAVHGAVSSAALALTTDVLVHHRKPEWQANP